VSYKTCDFGIISCVIDNWLIAIIGNLVYRNRT